MSKNTEEFIVKLFGAVFGLRVYGSIEDLGSEWLTLWVFWVGILGFAAEKYFYKFAGAFYGFDCGCFFL